jgi:hypothetical protein
LAKNKTTKRAKDTPRTIKNPYQYILKTPKESITGLGLKLCKKLNIAN